jgi:membrane protease YdiL (CAAX protease family)
MNKSVYKIVKNAIDDLMKKTWLRIFFIYTIDMLSFALDYSFLYQNDVIANILEWIDPAYAVQFLVIGIIGCVFICRQALNEFSNNIFNVESLVVFVVNIIFVFSITQIGAFIGNYEVNWVGVINRSIFCCIFVGITEEWIYRGFMVTQLRKVLTKKTVIVIISAIMFSVMHLPSFLLHAEDITILSLGYRLLIPFLLGSVFTAIYLLRNNLFVLIIIHGVYDLIECVAFDGWYFISYGIYWLMILGYLVYGLVSNNWRQRNI